MRPFTAPKGVRAAGGWRRWGEGAQHPNMLDHCAGERRDGQLAPEFIVGIL